MSLTTRRRSIPLIRRWQVVGNFGIFVLPSLVIFTAVVFVPIIWTLIIGMTDERATRRTTSFVGFANVIALAGDPDFLQSLANTVIITLIVVIGTNALGIAIALLLQKQGALYNVLRSMYFTPVILSSIVVSVIWRSLLVEDGLLNTVLRSVGVSNPPGWLTDPSIAVYSVSVIMVWQMLGFAVVVYLAGLAGIPQELDEAASLDGAGPLGRFRHVTWPLLAPSLTITTVMLMISSFKTYDQVAVLTNGGPGTGATATVAFEVIRSAFTDQRAGYASAMAGVMIVLVGLATAIVLRILQRREVTF